MMRHLIVLRYEVNGLIDRQSPRRFGTRQGTKRQNQKNKMCAKMYKSDIYRAAAGASYILRHSFRTLFFLSSRLEFNEKKTITEF
jgi:hypothetical protein